MNPPRFADRVAHVQTLVTAAVAAAQPADLVAANVALEGDRIAIAGRPLSVPGRAWLIATGKAAVTMAGAAAARLGARLAGGVVIDKRDPADVTLPGALRYFQGGHPVPTAASVTATRAVAGLLSETTADDLVLCLISGGTSALLTDPAVSLATWQALNRALLHAGCPIVAINRVRARLDPIKGGGLARLAAPARCRSLILSDVIGNELATIGSGPTVDEDRCERPAEELLATYDVWSRLSADATAELRAALSAAAPSADPFAADAKNTIIGDIGLAARAAREAAADLGFDATILTTYLDGEAREAGRFAAALARGAAAGRCLILGGETTVTVRGDGVGGRNQELALAAALALAGRPSVVVAACATDGDDGPLPPDGRPVAGAWIDGATVKRAADAGLDARGFLKRNDAYTFFARLGVGHLTAERGTNVNDLLLILTYGA